MANRKESVKVIEVMMMKQSMEKFADRRNVLQHLKTHLLDCKNNHHDECYAPSSAVQIAATRRAHLTPRFHAIEPKNNMSLSIFEDMPFRYPAIVEACTVQ